MKYLLILAALAIITASLKAQDLIVTNEGDSLNCKITSIKKDHIYFTFKHKDEIRNTLLPLSQVKHHQPGFYQTPEVPADKVVANEIYPHFRVAVQGGWSYRVAKLANNIPSDFKQYTRELKSGSHYGLDVSYYFSEQLGVGFKYSVYRSKNELNNVYVTRPDGSTQYGRMSDDISVGFFGPFFSTRLLNADKQNGLVSNFGIGYLGYTDKAVLISDYLIKGNTLGVCWDIGYDIGLSENVAIGVQISYTIGTLTKFELSDGTQTQTINLDKDNYENLSRLDFSVGLRFNK